MQEKTSEVAAICLRVGLNIFKSKTNIFKVSAASIEPFKQEGNETGEVETFTYLGSIIVIHGSRNVDAKARIVKAKGECIQLKNIWSTKVLSLHTKVRLFNSILKSVLLYGAETWRRTNTTNKKVQTFINNCMRRILQIRWSNTISNSDVYHNAFFKFFIYLK